jgi:hypothetical protein
MDSEFIQETDTINLIQFSLDNQEQIRQRNLLQLEDIKCACRLALRYRIACCDIGEPPLGDAQTLRADSLQQ